LIVIPAIDIRAGRCVRLQQGEMDKETVYSHEPELMAARWVELGAERLHLVDLDGAVHGIPVNREIVGRIAETVSVPIQLGGGVRDLEAIETYLNAGVSQLILGTSAITNLDFLRTACRAFPDHIILGIDARGDRIAVEGWTEETDLTPVEIAKDCEDSGISAIVYTDIHRDGMSTGPNIEATHLLASSVSIPIIASGGISGIQDVIDISKLAGDGVMGMITGRAIYQGTLDLAEAIDVAKKYSKI
jgi:phosphoribosylformimino-5-aminoimidazole carboxamide ribotide isomerase